MKLYFRRIYAIVFILALVVGGCLYGQNQYYLHTVQKEVESKISIKLDYMTSKIDQYFTRGVCAIDTLEDIVLATEDDPLRLSLFESMLDQTPSYNSLYFGTPDNQMINGSGWVPPNDFDLRERPWYKEAVSKGEFISTTPYLNASEDYWIVTFAKPVYDQAENLLGVIGGDSSLDEIIRMLRKQKISEHSFVFFLNSNKELIMHTNVEGLSIDQEVRDQFNQKYKDFFANTKEGLHVVGEDENKGFLAWNEIGETGWVVGNYAPFRDFYNAKQQMQIIAGLTIGFGLLIVGLMMLVQRRYIIKPLIKLSRDMEKISVPDDIGYRLAASKDDPFLEIRSITNEILNKMQDYFVRMKKSNEALEVSEQKIRAVLDVIPDLIFIYNSEGAFVDCMVSSDDVLLIPRDQFLGKTLDDVMPPEIAKKANRAIQSTLKTGEVQMFEYKIDIMDQNQFFETRLVKITEELVLAIVRDVTQSKEHLERIEHLSFHDQLTGLYNRRFYEEELMRLDTERNLPISLIMLDVNGLKLTNDAFGHIAGDALLKSVALVLEEVCRADDIIARIGGDEFVVLLPNTSNEETKNIVDRIQSESKKYVVESVPLSISIGWETKLVASETMTDVFIKAEDHMYRKKLVESQSMRNKTIKVILETLNRKNEREKIHSEKVSAICEKIGKHLKMTEVEINELRIAALMHDIGKIGISEAVLNKDGALTEAEYVEVMKHPEIGYQILKSVDAYSNLAEYALSHHERWDGSGYPKGTRGEDIPRISRIISVADAFEAMVSDRPYRGAITREEATLELETHAGTQFDPAVVEAFLKISDTI